MTTTPLGATLVLSLGLAACGGDTGDSPTGDRGHTLVVAEAREIGVVGGPPSVTARDVGATGVTGDRLLWLFGDTLFRPRSVDGESLRTCTAATSDVAAPLATREPTDASGAPLPCLPFTAEEAAFNRTSGRPDLRVALWPGSAVADGRGGLLVFYTKLIVNPGFLNYDLVGSGLARFAAGATSGTREPGLIFPASEPAFDNALVVGSDVFVYGMIGGTQDVAAARAPLAQAAERGAYRFWDGSGWATEARQSRALFGGVSGALTVSYNRYLGRYLATSSEVLSNRVLLRTAPAPEGPWSAPVTAFTGVATAGSIDYAAREHAELAQDGGRRLFVTYYRPLGGFAGELRAVEVVLQ
jgi:hypothetical protein